jgi:hypothetical protein
VRIKMKAEDLKEAQEYFTDIFAELRHLFKWQLLAAFTCFYLAYVLGDFSLAYFILCGAGFALLICTNYNSLQVRHLTLKIDSNFLIKIRPNLNIINC